MGSQHLVRLHQWPQPVSYVGHNDEVFKLHHEIMPQRAISLSPSFCSTPRLGPPCLVGALPVLVLSLCGGFVDPNRLCAHVRSWACGCSNRAFLVCLILRGNVFYRLTPYFSKSLGRLRLSDLLKDPGQTPFLNAYTIMGSSVVPTFTTCAPKRLMYSFRVSP